jgi:FMN-dependent NADH-azoreductase
MTTSSNQEVFTMNNSKNLLKVQASLFGAAGASTQLADEFTARWRERNPGASVRVRDVAAQPLPHLSAERFQAFLAKPEERSPEHAANAGESDLLIGELKAADVVVLAAPMYNFGVPSTLRAYFDHIARAGATFRYTEKGAEGLLKNKQAVIIATRGGFHIGAESDGQTSYLKTFLALLGVTDLEFVYAEGLAMGPEAREQALQTAREDIVRLVDRLAPADRAAA